MKRYVLVATGWWMLFGGWSAYAADSAPQPAPNAHQMQLEVLRARLDSDQKMVTDFQAKAEAARMLVQSDQAAVNAMEHPAAASVQQMPGKPMAMPQSSRVVPSSPFGGAHPAPMPAPAGQPAQHK